MSCYGRFEISITTATQDELDKIAEAIFNGYAEHVLKERILWSAYAAPPAPQVQIVQQSAQTQPYAEHERVSQGEPAPALQRIETHVSAPKAVAQGPKPERTAGIIGRGRMGRSSK